MTRQPAKPQPAQSPDAAADKPGQLYDLERDTQNPHKIPGTSGDTLHGEHTDRAGNGRQDRRPAAGKRP